LTCANAESGQILERCSRRRFVRVVPLRSLPQSLPHTKGCACRASPRARWSCAGPSGVPPAGWPWSWEPESWAACPRPPTWWSAPTGLVEGGCRLVQDGVLDRGHRVVGA
jgi:hypothetical protein